MILLDVPPSPLGGGGRRGARGERSFLSSRPIFSSSTCFGRQLTMGNSSPKGRNKSNTAMNTSYIRRAYHSGSWYDDDPRLLDNMLSKFMADASQNKSDAYETESTTDSENNGSSEKSRSGIPRACISPHAGFQYSGPTAAYSYLSLKEALLSNPSLSTVVVLHPSHHVYLEGCAVSGESRS